MAVVAGPHAEARLAALAAAPDLEADDPLRSRRRALALARGRVVLVVSGDDVAVVRLRPDPAREPRPRASPWTPRCSAPRAARTPSRPGRAEVTEPGARYVDFLVPGLLGMNLMGTGMWGIGFSLVVARNGNLLKRLVAAPARRSHLLGAQLTSRLIFLIPEAGALLLFALLRARRADARLGRCC